MSSIYCPNCGKEGTANHVDTRGMFHEWDCNNDNCRVSLYQVPKDLTEL